MALLPRRRGFRFSLRTLFVLMTLVCIWLAYELNWIRQRRAFLAENPRVPGLGESIDDLFAPPRDPPHAPGLLWLFGEQGVSELCIVNGDTVNSDLAERARSLFPEATLQLLRAPTEWILKDIEFDYSHTPETEDQSLSPSPLRNDSTTVSEPSSLTSGDSRPSTPADLFPPTFPTPLKSPAEE